MLSGKRQYSMKWAFKKSDFRFEQPLWKDVSIAASRGKTKRAKEKQCLKPIAMSARDKGKGITLPSESTAMLVHGQDLAARRSNISLRQVKKKKGCIIKDADGVLARDLNRTTACPTL